MKKVINFLIGLLLITNLYGVELLIDGKISDTSMQYNDAENYCKKKGNRLPVHGEIDDIARTNTRFSSYFIWSSSDGDEDRTTKKAYFWMNYNGIEFAKEKYAFVICVKNK